MTDDEFAALKEKILHRWRYPEAEQSEAVAKLLAEAERARASEKGS